MKNLAGLYPTLAKVDRRQSDVMDGFEGVDKLP